MCDLECYADLACSKYGMAYRERHRSMNGLMVTHLARRNALLVASVRRKKFGSAKKMSWIYRSAADLGSTLTPTSGVVSYTDCPRWLYSPIPLLRTDTRILLPTSFWRMVKRASAMPAMTQATE